MTEEAQAALDDGLIIDAGIEEATEIIPESTESTVDSTIDADNESQVIEISKEQKALNQLAFEKREEKRQRKAAEEELERVKAQIPQQVVTDVAPTREQFDFDEDKYSDALVTYRVKQEAQQIEQRYEDQQANAKLVDIQNVWNAKEAKLVEKASDYQESVGRLPVFPNDTLNAIMQADKGPELAYYLSKHLDVADSIASMSPMQAALQLGQISAQISNVKQKTNSAAPAPIEPIESPGSLSSDKDSPLIAGATFE